RKPARVKQGRRPLGPETLESRVVLSTTSVLGGLNIADVVGGSFPVSGQFSVAGVTVKADSLQATGQSGHISITGGASFTLQDGTAFTARLGDTAHPEGLVIDGGKLSKLNFAIGGGFKFKGLQFTGSGLGASYEAPSLANGQHAAIDIFGTAGVAFGSRSLTV